MNVVVEQIGPCRRKLKIEVPAETISKEYDQALKAYRQNTQIPGFRKGNAPANMVKARYHKQILERMREVLLPASYRDALAKESLDVEQIVGMDEEIHVEVGSPLSFEVTVDVKPEFTLPTYKGIALSRNKVEPTAEDVEKAIDGIRERQAKFEDVTGRPVGTGDLVQIDFSGSVDGKTLAELDPAAAGVGEGKDFWIQANEEAFLPEIGQALPGLNVGETTDVKVTFAADFVIESLRGKSVDYKVSVKGLRAKILPELDESFLKKMEVESAEALREQVKEGLVREGQRAEDGRLRHEIEKFLMDNTTVELPESVVAQEASRQVRRIVDQASRNGMNQEQFEQEREAIFSAAQNGAQQSVKLRYILTRIAKEEKISVSDSEMRREMAMMAYGYGMQPADLEKQIEKNNAREDFRGDVLVRRAMDFLFANAAITE